MQGEDERVANMDADQFYSGGGGKYLRGSDVAGQEWELTIKEAFEDKDFNGNPAIALNFEEIEQQLTLNKTNYLMVKEHMGTSETNEWIGKKIPIRGIRDLNPKGEMVDCIRITPPEQEVKRVTPGKLRPKKDEPLDDGVPF